MLKRRKRGLVAFFTLNEVDESLDSILALSFALEMRVRVMLVYVPASKRIDPGFDIALRDEYADGFRGVAGFDAMIGQFLIELADSFAKVMLIGIDHHDQSDVHPGTHPSKQHNLIGESFSNELVGGAIRTR